MKNIKRNIFYRMIYNVIVTLTPLLTTPYVARILGTEGVGVFSYTLSIAYYFTLFATLGIATYGCREIAKCAEDKVKRSERFFEIYFWQILFSCISFFSYVVYIVTFENKYKTLFIFQCIRIVACLFDVSWMMFGLEEFVITVKRDLFIKVITIISIFCFVRGDNALNIYTFIMAITTFFSALIMIPFVISQIKFSKINKDALLRDIIPIFLFFIPTISSNLFHEVDVTILGKNGMLIEAGCYHNADRIINMPKGIIIGLGTVFLSRTARISDNTSSKTKHFYTKVDELYTFLVSPIAIGIACVSSEFIPIFLGEGYEGCTKLIIWLSIVLIIRTYNNHLLMGYYLPFEKEKIYTFITLITTVLNVILDIFFIKNFGALGAIWVTIICEGIVYLYLIMRADKKIIGLSKKEALNNLVYFLFGIIMGLIILLSKGQIVFGGITKFVIEIMIGVVVYITLCVGYWHVYAHSALGIEFMTLKGKLKKKNSKL